MIKWKRSKLVAPANDFNTQRKEVIKWLWNYGKYVKQKRLDLELPQYVVAQAIGRSNSYLSHIEMGERYSEEDNLRLRIFFKAHGVEFKY